MWKLIKKLVMIWIKPLWSLVKKVVRLWISLQLRNWYKWAIVIGVFLVLVLLGR